MAARNFKLFLGCLGNGVTVCNSAVMEDGDFKMVAHISTREKSLGTSARITRLQMLSQASGPAQSRSG